MRESPSLPEVLRARHVEVVAPDGEVEDHPAHRPRGPPRGVRAVVPPADQAPAGDGDGGQLRGPPSAVDRAELAAEVHAPVVGAHRDRVGAPTPQTRSPGPIGDPGRHVETNGVIDRQRRPGRSHGRTEVTHGVEPSTPGVEVADHGLATRPRTADPGDEAPIGGAGGRIERDHAAGGHAVGPGELPGGDDGPRRQHVEGIDRTIDPTVARRGSSHRSRCRRRPGRADRCRGQSPPASTTVVNLPAA